MDLREKYIMDMVNGITLYDGGHYCASDGMCVMEAVSYIAGEEFSEHPECACPVVTAFMISLNDSLRDEDRDRWIKPLIPSIIGSRVLLENGQEDIDVQVKRALVAGDAALRQFIPFTLDQASVLFAAKDETAIANLCSDYAATLRALPEQTTLHELETSAQFAHTALDPINLGPYGDEAYLVSWCAHSDLFDLATRADNAAFILGKHRGIYDDIETIAEIGNVAHFAVRPNCDQTIARAEEINECRTSVALKMLAVGFNSL